MLLPPSSCTLSCNFVNMYTLISWRRAVWWWWWVIDRWWLLTGGGQCGGEARWWWRRCPWIVTCRWWSERRRSLFLARSLGRTRHYEVLLAVLVVENVEILLLGGSVSRWTDVAMSRVWSRVWVVWRRHATRAITSCRYLRAAWYVHRRAVQLGGRGVHQLWRHVFTHVQRAWHLMSRHSQHHSWLIHSLMSRHSQYHSWWLIHSLSSTAQQSTQHKTSHPGDAHPANLSEKIKTRKNNRKYIQQMQANRQLNIR